jgi:cyclophilin family peptidyl-prolyl cis-trans isomerase
MKNLLSSLITTFILSIFMSTSVLAANPKALIETSMGNIEVELYADKAPLSVKNFETYANEGFYNGTIFHRVIKNFMIQTGGLDVEMTKKETHAPIKNEATNKLKNDKGTLAMARTGQPHSATSQFFINTKDNESLNYGGRAGWGYAVFGKVIKGMDVVTKIEYVKTKTVGGRRDVPAIAIEIKKISIIK